MAVKRPAVSPKPELPAAAVVPEDMQGAVTWAEAILWAAENMHLTKMSKRRAGSDQKLTMWRASREYPKELLFQLCPKAIDILNKNRVTGSQTEIEAAEEKSIEELEDLLGAAVAAAQ